MDDIAKAVFNTHDKVVVDPFFAYMQDYYPMPDHVAESTLAEMSAKVFYTNHLTSNQPVLITDGIVGQKAYEVWDYDYLTTALGKK